jgi:crotonobetainyl-CoA:carnitine CoA-transferase CaiB-like acyl-CoA transferase
MAAGNDRLWRATCETIGRNDLLEQPGFACTVLRAANQAQLKEILEREFARYRCVELLEALGGAGVPIAPINSCSEALDDEQVRYMQWIQPINLPNGRRTKTFASPLRLTGRGFPIYRRASHRTQRQCGTRRRRVVRHEEQRRKHHTQGRRH